MAKAPLEFVVAWRWHHAHPRSHLIEHLLHIHGPLHMHQHIEQPKLELTHHRHGALEIFGPFEIGDHLLWQSLARLVMLGKESQYLLFVGEIFQKLAGKLHRIPLHSCDTTDCRLFDLAEQMVQGVPHLVKEGHHIVWSQETWLSIGSWSEVGHDVGHRMDHLAIFVDMVGDPLIHPSTTTLALSGLKIYIEPSHQPMGQGDLVAAHTRMPNGCLHPLEAKTKELVQKAKEPLYGRLFFKIGLVGLVIYAVSSRLELFAPVGHIVGLQLITGSIFLGESLKLLELPFGLRAALGGELFQKAHHHLWTLGHLGLEA